MTIEEVVAPVQEALRIDGADLAFKGRRGGVAQFELKRDFADLVGVEIGDPRSARL
jgi:hypothetical protein